MSCIRCSAFWLVLLTLCFSPAHPAQVESRSDEAALRELINDFFAAWAKKDLKHSQGMELKSSELPSRLKTSQETFAAQQNIEVKGLNVRKLSIDGEATARVEMK
jgi:hypothetical protein